MSGRRVLSPAKAGSTFRAAYPGLTPGARILSRAARAEHTRGRMCRVPTLCAARVGMQANIARHYRDPPRFCASGGAGLQPCGLAATSDSGFSRRGTPPQVPQGLKPAGPPGLPPLLVSSSRAFAGLFPLSRSIRTIGLRNTSTYGRFPWHLWRP